MPVYPGAFPTPPPPTCSPSSAASSSPPDFDPLDPNSRPRQKSRPSAWPGKTQRHNSETGVVPELLEMSQIPWPGPISERDHQARSCRAAADPGGRLDVLGGVLRLSDDEHQPEPLDIDADLEHRGRKHHVIRHGGRAVRLRAADVRLADA